MGCQQDGDVVAVADASFLIGLSMIQRLSLVREVVGRVLVAPAVWTEVVTRGAGRPGQRELREADFVEVRPVRNRVAVAMGMLSLGPGEAESLVLLQEAGASLFLADDPKARRAARKAGVRAMGVAGLLLAAKHRGFIAEVRPLLELLLDRGFRIGRELIRGILRDAGELDPDPAELE